MFAQSCRVAPAGLPKAEATELAPEAVGAGPLTAIKTRVVSTGRLGGPSWTTRAFGETPERRLWAIQREDRRACPAHPMVSFTDRFPQRRTGAIKEALHPATLASSVVILAYRFAHCRLRRRH